ncbi:MAG: hypothetical protein QW561_01700 [Candidatus Aenigmatarchaeota archaeon]
MAAQDPAGSELYWFKGLPCTHLQKAVNPPDQGSESFWFEGLPATDLFPAAPPVVPVGSSNLMTLLGVGV